jgi:hypothetical protein
MPRKECTMPNGELGMPRRSQDTQQRTGIAEREFRIAKGDPVMLKRGLWITGRMPDMAK